MGQRHQVFVVTRNQPGDLNYYAFHNQWCYGTLPLQHLKRVIQYQEKADNYCRIGGDYEDESHKIASILGTDPKEGVYSYYLPTTGEHTDKTGNIHLDWGDNNDGITIILTDAKSKRISYCFMNISQNNSMWGFMNISQNNDQWEPNTPLSAEDYISMYYNKTSKEWSAYEIDKLINFINKKARLLTMKKLRQYFKVHYKGKKTEMEKVLNCPKKDLPLWIGKGFKGTQTIVERRLKECSTTTPTGPTKT